MSAVVYLCSSNSRCAASGSCTVKSVEVHDPLAAHRELLLHKYTTADMHNLFTYLETLK